VLEDGVCGGKVCCIRVKYEEKEYVLKEMKKTFNYGVDYELMDLLKEKVGLKSMNLKRIKCDYGLVKVDPKIKSYKNNWEFKSVKGGVIYCMMDYFENDGDIGKWKDMYERNKIEILKIRLFDGLFRSSDNIMRNILINKKENKLLSIDENDIFGKRKLIFNKNDWCKKVYNKELFNRVIGDIKDKLVKEDVIEMLSKYGFENKVTEFAERYDTYELIVENECK
jgi:hypothetical protein